MASVPSKSTDESPPPTRDPSTLILRIGDTLSSHVNEIDRAYRVYTASLWVVGVLAFVDTLFIVSVWTSATLLTQLIFASFDAILIGFVVYGLWAKKGFGLVDDIDWEVNRFRFITTFELLPPEGNTPAERIWNSLKRASTAAEELQDLPADEVKFDVEVDGKSGKRYPFDVFVHKEPRSRLRRFLAKWTLRGSPTHWLYYWFFPRLHERLHEDLLTILVKRISKTTPVTKSDLETSKKEFEDVSRKLHDIPEHAVVVSASGFSQDALDYARDEESAIRPFADDEESAIMDLLVERSDESFEVAHYG
jgi:hypothetical protein